MPSYALANWISSCGFSALIPFHAESFLKPAKQSLSSENNFQRVRIFAFMSNKIPVILDGLKKGEDSFQVVHHILLQIFISN